MDHPRIRGEHCDYSVLHVAEIGSSPHTRGAPAGARDHRPGSRIIPAYAGSTVGRRRCCSGIWDHPRIRGEHRVRLQSLRRHGGSSPHTRGALRVHLVRDGDDRIIPAYAGSTSPYFLLIFSQADHPRIRGEHTYGAKKIALRRGSSPHTRGARRRRHSLGEPERIIPAYAGSTCGPGRRGPCGADHPRIRGEHDIPFQIHPNQHGSSPHTRGALLAPSGRGRLRRIIPAYAGSTDAGSQAGTETGDHPRIRGEHSPLATMSA